MPVVAAQFQGRLGNCMFTYAFARAYAEKHGFEFQCDSWDGQKIFKLDDNPIENVESLTKRDENTLMDGEGDIVIRSYCQQQKCLIYTKRDCLRWFQLQDWVHEALSQQAIHYRNVAHRRMGDYVGYLYPLISMESYWKVLEKPGHAHWDLITEENPVLNHKIPDSLSWLPDFYIMAHADLLLRGNSSFSWWAATLNRHGKIYAPVMNGCKGGIENDVEFVEGNWPSFNPNLSFVTDLHLQP